MTGPVLPGIRPIQAPELPGAAARSSPAGEFAQAMSNALGAVDALQKESHAGIARLLSGEVEDLHKAALEHQRAALAFDLLLQVRNKAVQAYQEIMRMQV
jgi:flagellar hook-basal body complex protein FliE